MKLFLLSIVLFLNALHGVCSISNLPSALLQASKDIKDHLNQIMQLKIWSLRSGLNELENKIKWK